MPRRARAPAMPQSSLGNGAWWHNGQENGSNDVCVLRPVPLGPKSKSSSVIFGEIGVDTGRWLGHFGIKNTGLESGDHRKTSWSCFWGSSHEVATFATHGCLGQSPHTNLASKCRGKSTGPLYISRYKSLGYLGFCNCRCSNVNQSIDNQAWRLVTICPSANTAEIHTTTFLVKSLVLQLWPTVMSANPASHG